MKNDLKKSPKLGLYLAIIWLAVPAFLGACWRLFTEEFFPALVNAWKAVGERK